MNKQVIRLLHQGVSTIQILSVCTLWTLYLRLRHFWDWIFVHVVFLLLLDLLWWLVLGLAFFLCTLLFLFGRLFLIMDRDFITFIPLNWCLWYRLLIKRINNRGWWLQGELWIQTLFSLAFTHGCHIQLRSASILSNVINRGCVNFISRMSPSLPFWNTWKTLTDKEPL